MPRIIFRIGEAQEHVVDAPTGTSVMQAAVLNNVPGIDADCGGCCSCATCRVVVEEDWRQRVGPPGEDEADTLMANDFGLVPGLRLGCQIELSDAVDGLCVTVARDFA